MLPGVKSKLALGSWFKVFYVMLKNMKFLRGTPFDFMAWFSNDVRKADRKALDHYKSILTKNIDEIGNGKYQDLKDFFCTSNTSYIVFVFNNIVFIR